MDFTEPRHGIYRTMPGPVHRSQGVRVLLRFPAPRRARRERRDLRDAGSPQGTLRRHPHRRREPHGDGAHGLRDPLRGSRRARPLPQLRRALLERHRERMAHTHRGGLGHGAAPRRAPRRLAAGRGLYRPLRQHRAQRAHRLSGAGGRPLRSTGAAGSARGAHGGGRMASRLRAGAHRRVAGAGRSSATTGFSSRRCWRWPSCGAAISGAGAIREGRRR